MRRWFAGFMALLLFLAGGAAAAEEASGLSDAEIQESVVTREDYTGETVAGNLQLLMELYQNEDVRSLLELEDVREIVAEILLKTAAWMYANRPVTMKILAELGISENDRDCIGLLWDSTDRIRGAWSAYLESEDGKLLLAQMEALAVDPDFMESVDNFQQLVSSEDIAAVVSRLSEAAGKPDPAPADGLLTERAAESLPGSGTFTGSLLLKLLHQTESSEWARTSLPKLASNQNLWQVLEHLAYIQGDVDRVIQEEYGKLAGNPEMVDFFNRYTQEAVSLLRLLRSPSSLMNRTEDKEVAP